VAEKMSFSKICLFVFVILGVCNFSSALKWDNLKVTFGLNLFSSNAFAPMPLNSKAAENQNWENLSSSCENHNNFYGFRYMYENDPGITLLYDINGIICGIQMNLLKNEVVSSKNKYKYDKVSMYQTTSIKGQEVYTLTAYFVNPKNICTTGRRKSDVKNNGIGTGLYLQNSNTVPPSLIKVPMKRGDAIKEGWSKNECFFGMGYHNFYKSEEFNQTDCLEIRPVFLLYNSDDELHGFGFASSGAATSPRFEHPGPSALKHIIGEDVVDCLLENSKTPGISTVHVYFINRPYWINCWF
jgi:hypothetical protein